MFLMFFSIIKETAMFFTAGNVVSAFGELFCLLKMRCWINNSATLGVTIVSYHDILSQFIYTTLLSSKCGFVNKLPYFLVTIISICIPVLRYLWEVVYILQGLELHCNLISFPVTACLLFLKHNFTCFGGVNRNTLSPIPVFLWGMELKLIVLWV